MTTSSRRQSVPGAGRFVQQALRGRNKLCLFFPLPKSSHKSKVTDNIYAVSVFAQVLVVLLLKFVQHNLIIIIMIIIMIIIVIIIMKYS